MAKRRKSNKQTALERMQGAPLNTATARQKFGAVKRQWLAESAEEAALKKKAAKALSQVEKSPKPDPKQQQAIGELLRITESLARRKLSVPRRRLGVPDTYGNYTLRFTPPYLQLGTVVAGQITSVTGDPTIVATGDDYLGQLSCSVDTNRDKASAGTASNQFAVQFKPMFDNATARITFESNFAWSYYVNSIRNKPAYARAQGLIRLMEYDGHFVQPSLQLGAFIGYNMSAENELKWNAISATGPSWALEAKVNSNRNYFVVVSLETSASGAGWPGSLAGSRAIVTVPSISVHISGEPLLQNA
jgi:hypothetical protein